MNKVFILGNLGKDPEHKELQGGKTVCTFSVATKEKDNTEWHDVEVWEKLADNCNEYLAKGKKVLVEGRLKTEKWEKDGQKRSKIKIVGHNVQFLSPKEESGGGIPT